MRLKVKTVETKPAPQPVRRVVRKIVKSEPVEEAVTKVPFAEFKAATRSALEVATYTKSLCLYSGTDSKGKKYDICMLPSGHDGPHMSVDPAEIPVTQPRKMVIACDVTFDFGTETIPQELTDILYAWRKVGNPNATALEVELLAFSKGIAFESKITNAPAVYALWYLGFLDRSEPEKHDLMGVVKYKLSKKGLKATDEIARLIGDSKPDVALKSDDDCTVCGGSGFDEETENECTHCKGTGTEPAKRPTRVVRGRVSPPEKTNPVKKAVESEPVKTIDCGRCQGSGLYKGKVCDTCFGNGEVPANWEAPNKFANIDVSPGTRGSKTKTVTPNPPGGYAELADFLMSGGPMAKISDSKTSRMVPRRRK